MAGTAQSSTEGNNQDGRESSADEDQERPFSAEEEDLIIRMYRLVGKRWALIAGRIPGRTAQEIKTYWNNRHSSRN